MTTQATATTWCEPDGSTQRKTISSIHKYNFLHYLDTAFFKIISFRMGMFLILRESRSRSHQDFFRGVGPPNPSRSHRSIKGPRWLSTALCPSLIPPFFPLFLFSFFPSLVPFFSQRPFIPVFQPSSCLLSFFPLFLHSFVSSAFPSSFCFFLRSSFPSFHLSFLSSSIIPSFLLSFLSSVFLHCLISFVRSFVRSFISLFLLSFLRLVLSTLSSFLHSLHVRWVGLQITKTDFVIR